VPVGVGGQLAGDLCFQRLDLAGQRGHRDGQGGGDACLGGAVGAGGPGRRGLQPRVQQLAGAKRPRTGRVRSHASIACSSSAAAASWLPNSVRNVLLTA
jgi:hypothetical protein